MSAEVRFDLSMPAEEGLTTTCGLILAAHRQLDVIKGRATTVGEIGPQVGPACEIERLYISMQVVESARRWLAESRNGRNESQMLTTLKDHILSLTDAEWEEFQFILHPEILVDLRPYVDSTSAVSGEVATLLTSTRGGIIGSPPPAISAPRYPPSH